MPGCDATSWISNEAYLRDFNQRAIRQRIPLSGNLDLTHRCNLRCVHCYLGAGSDHEVTGATELATGQWLQIIDQIAEAGCLYLLLTGGEPLLREDFGEIFRHAKNSGMLVTIFTNGTLVDGKILELFKTLPPRAVEISVYGVTSKTHDGITGVPGSHAQVLAALDKLRTAGVNLRLKTILMKTNKGEFFALEKMALDMGVPFRFDAAVFPRLNGHRSPLDLRVTPEEAVELEFSNPKRSEEWKEFYGCYSQVPASSRLYPCGAARTHFHIDPTGNLQPCLLVTRDKYSLNGVDFSTGWDIIGKRLDQRKADPDQKCADCSKKSLCGYCPGFFELENGSETVPSEYLCETGQKRYNKLL